MTYQKPSVSIVLLAILLALVISGCGKKGGDKKLNTQVVAKVNGDEISIHQVDFQLSRLGQLSEEQSKAAAKQIVNRLVDQQLFVQKAMEAKLDRDPHVLQALENAKYEILAQAYLEHQVAQAAKPGSKEIEDFYNTHPELFEKRRIYRLQELAVQVGNDKVDEISNAAKSAKGIGDIAVWLKSKDYSFSANANVRAAEQLPQELLQQFQKMKDGDIVVIPTGQSVNIVQVAASQEQPISREKATTLIEQYFLNQHKLDLAKKEVEKLHTAAKIEYFGNFADMKTAAKAEPESKKAEVRNVAKPDGSKQTSTDTNHIDKGLAGL